MSELKNSQPRIDLIFSAHGSAVPGDHGYALYSAVSHIIPTVHKAEDVGLFPIRGAPAGDGTLLLGDHSSLRIRLTAVKLPDMLPLAGKLLDLCGFRVRLGVPHVSALTPAAVLSSTMVLIKLARPPEAQNTRLEITPDRFLIAARKKLEELGIRGEPALHHYRSGPRAGQARRRVMHVKDQTHVGYAMLVQGLTAEESIRLQQEGLGGRRLMGCGLFLPHDLAKES